MIKKTNKQGDKAKDPEAKISSPAKLRPIGLDRGKVWMRDIATIPCQTNL